MSHRVRWVCIFILLYNCCAYFCNFVSFYSSSASFSNLKLKSLLSGEIVWEQPFASTINDVHSNSKLLLVTFSMKIAAFDPSKLSPTALFTMSGMLHNMMDNGLSCVLPLYHSYQSPLFAIVAILCLYFKRMNLFVKGNWRLFFVELLYLY